MLGPMPRLTLWLCAWLLACSRPAAEPAPQSQPLRRSEQQGTRIVAIGDLHGDLEATRRALRLASAIGPDDHWTGGKLQLVQTGDTLDRGDQDREVLDLIERLRGEAARAGGAFIALSGNHEVMNVAGDLRYVSPKSAAAFEPDRAHAFAPGAPYARRFADWPVIAQLGETLFVHGGVLPHHVRYGIERLNRETAAWMRGTAPPPALLMQEDAPIWTRVYSAPGLPADCVQLAQALSAAHARRMVVGHTPQPQGISAACDERVYRIDTGMSRFYGGPTQVLEIEGERVRVLSEAGR
jgi:predicted MPP superfamily phosphohydrolase